tara:strand:- start:59415 stop:59717 length:303 start_codon:yes stop_codon:yes gene_type:complete
MGGMTWQVGNRRRHTEILTAMRRQETTTALAGGIKPQPIIVDHSDHAQDEPVVPGVAETRDQAWNQLIWAGMVLVLALAVGMLHKLGVPLPFLNKKKDSQ